MVQKDIGGAVCLMIQEIISSYMLMVFIIVQMYGTKTGRKRKFHSLDQSYSMIHRMPDQVKHLHRIVDVSDTDCIVNLRMDRNTFHRLCVLLRDLGGLNDGKYVTMEEQVASFLGILAHHKKNRIVGFDFNRSGQTISYYLHIVLKAILKLRGILLVKPQPVSEDYTDPRWKWFKGCLRAIDDTYIKVKVCNSDKPRYRTRKGQISTNTLVVCDRNLRFVYILPGWEGSAGDSRVLRDVVTRSNGLKVPHGNYYLCDNGYANCDDFLTPYKSVQYHLKEWGPNCSVPQNPKEIFNMRHTKARNVIEHIFGVMKMRKLPLVIMEARSEDFNLMSSCECGRGRLKVQPASTKAHHPGWLYYKCSSKNDSCGYWKWYDKYHQASEGGFIPNFVRTQVYEPTTMSSMSATSNPNHMPTANHAPKRCLKVEDHIHIDYLFMATVLVLLGFIIAKLI